MASNARAHKAMKDFSKSLDKGMEKAMARASKKSAAQLLKFTKQTFKEQKDPHGTPWKKKKRPDGRKILHGPTGELRRLWKVEEATREKWSVASQSFKYKFHQDGTKHIPRRAMTPWRGLPKRYSDAFEAIYVTELSKALGGK